MPCFVWPRIISYFQYRDAIAPNGCPFPFNLCHFPKTGTEDTPAFFDSGTLLSFLRGYRVRVAESSMCFIIDKNGIVFLGSEVLHGDGTAAYGNVQYDRLS